MVLVNLVWRFMRTRKQIFLEQCIVLIMNGLMMYIMIDWIIVVVKMQRIVCIAIHLNIITLIKVEVKYFHVQDLRIGIKRVVLTSILVCQIAHIINKKRYVKIYYDNNNPFDLHFRGNLIKLNMDIYIRLSGSFMQ